MNVSRLLLLAAIALAIMLFGAFDGASYLSLSALKTEYAALTAFRDANRPLTIALYVAIYIATTGLSLPGATVLTLAGGALFGLFWGTVIVSFASTIGATLAFLAARFLFRDGIQQRFGDRLKTINDGIERDGAYYLFTLRLVPLFPFFVINVLMGLTPLKIGTFYWVSQIGMLAGTLVYVNAGTQLAQLDTPAGLLSPSLLLSFALLGLFPLLTRKILDAVQAAKIYRGWTKPERFDCNLVVIGAGAGGLVTAYIAAALNAKVALIEKHAMGGDCLNTGCVPSKTLIRSARLLAQIRSSRAFGIKVAQADADFAEVMARVRQVIADIAPHDSVRRYTDLGVDVITGAATIVSPWSVVVATDEGCRTLTTRAIVIAAGAQPVVPAIPGLDETGYLTSDTVWRLTEKPERLLVLGGGAIGCELAQAFARLGCRVTVLEVLPRLLMREDEEVGQIVQQRFVEAGITVLTAHQAVRFNVEHGDKILLAEHQGQTVRIGFDQVLLALGRAATIDGYGADTLGLALSPQQALATNAFLQTNYPNIYACGDVAGPYQFTHSAAHQAWYAAVNALFDPFVKFRADYAVIPWAVFVDPEIARVGLNEQDAKAQGVAYEISRYELNDLDRAMIDGVAHGFVKVLTVPGSDKILGVTIVGEQAAELIAEFVLAMKYSLGLNKVLAAVHIYPTLAEANKYAAGVWKRQQAPKTLLAGLRRYHGWRRRG